MIYLSLVFLITTIASLKYLRINNGLVFIILIFSFSIRGNLGNDISGYKLLLSSDYYSHIKLLSPEGLFYNWFYLFNSINLFLFFHTLFYFILLYFIIVTYKIGSRSLFFLFFFINPYLFLVHMSALRQSLAILIIAIFIGLCLNHRKHFYIFSGVLLAIGFHLSAVMMIFTSPLIKVFEFLKKIKVKYYSISVFIFLTALLVVFDVVNSKSAIFNLLDISGLLKYNHYLDHDFKNSVISLLNNISIYVLITLLGVNLFEKNPLVVILALISVFLLIISHSFPYISRFGMYFDIFVPIMLSFVVRPSRLDLALITILLLLYGIRYVRFFLSDIFGPYFINYFPLNF